MNPNNKYARGKVYKLVSDQTDQIYIGSTTSKYLTSRLSCHNYHYKAHTEGTFKQVVASYDIVKYPDARIVLLEAFPCETKAELLEREQWYLNQNRDVCVNKCNARLDLETKKQKAREYNQQHKEQLSEKGKQRYQKNREQILEKLNEKTLCECGHMCSKANKRYHVNSKKHIKGLLNNN